MQGDNGLYPAEKQKKKRSALRVALISVGCVAAAAVVFLAGFFTYRLTLDDGLKSLLWFKDRIRDEYYKEISDEDFWRAAIDGVENILDDYSCYYSADEYDAVLNSDRGIKDGVGLSFFSNTNMVYKVAVGSPAFYAESEAGERAEAGMFLTGVGESADSVKDTFTAAAVSEALGGAGSGDTLFLRLSKTAANDTQNCVLLSVEYETYTESYVLYATAAHTYALVFDDNAENGTWQLVGDGMEELSAGEAYIRLVQFEGNAAEEFAAQPPQVRMFDVAAAQQ